MKEKDIHVLIEQEDLEAKQRIMDRVHARVDVAAVLKAQAASTDGKVASSDVKPADVKTFTKSKVLKWALAVFAAVVVITLSVVLPLTLKGGVRYCSADQYTVVTTEQTLREYSLSHNNKFLFTDWYDFADEVTTNYAHINDDVNNIVFWEETIINSETGAKLTLSVTDNKTRVDKFDKYYQDPMEFFVDDVVVRYKESKNMEVIATFEYGNYLYYLDLNFGNGLEEITEIIQGMLNSH